MKKICRVLFFSVLLVFLLDLGWSVEAEKVKLLANQVHSMFRNLVLVQKVPVANALQQQRQVLLQNADVREAIEVPGHNLFVHFKDGNELLMFLGEDRLGSAVDQKAKQVVPQVQKQPQQAAQINPELLKMYYPCAPNSHKALIFDCLEDDANVVTPKIAQQVKMDLEALGYTVTSQLNNNANLANATLMDDGEYGVVFMRGHGGVFGDNYFVFQIRPWYDSYPPANSGYTGTLRASAYCQAQGKTMFIYVISGQFSNAYWQNKPLPSTLFFLESCHGTNHGPGRHANLDCQPWRCGVVGLE